MFSMGTTMARLTIRVFDAVDRRSNDETRPPSTLLAKQTAVHLDKTASRQ